MRPALHARLQNREPEPGLINLPIPVPSVPVLSPILTPLVAGNNQGNAPAPTAPQPVPAPARPAPPLSAPTLPAISLPALPLPAPPRPAPPPQQLPASPPPPASNPPSGGNGGGGSPPSGGDGGGGSPPSGGNGGGGSPPSGGNGGGDSPPSGGNGGGDSPPSGGNGGGGSPPNGGNGGGGGGGPPSSGGSSGNPGNGKSNPSNSGNVGSDNGSSPSGVGGSTGFNPNGSPQGNSGGSPHGNSGGSPHGNSGSGSPSDSAPSLTPSGTSLGSGSDKSLSVGSGTTVKVSSTGVVALPLNNVNDEGLALSNGSTQSDVVQNALGQSSSATMASASPITPAGSLVSPDSSHGSPSVGQGSSGSGTGTGPTDANNASPSRSHLSSGAIGAIVATLVILFTLLVFFVLRKRYSHRKAERQVKWINSHVSEETPDMQEAQRCTSVRSSWGTPVEHRFSDSSQWDTSNSTPDLQEGTYHNAGPYAYTLSESGAPVLPMPVHSPTEDRSYSPEDPFAVRNSLSPQPIKSMSSLPIRISLISTGSGPRDPFDDAYGYIVDDHASESRISGATSGNGSGLNRDTTHGTQANFPMPPPTAGSSSTVFAIGSPSDLLKPPGIRITFPDSPISPTFAASGTSSYPRRASVKLHFQPSQERQDEVSLGKGDQVNVISVYEDGWAFVQNENNNERGLAPLNCLEIDNP